MWSLTPLTLYWFWIVESFKIVSFTLQLLIFKKYLQVAVPSAAFLALIKQDGDVECDPFYQMQVIHAGLGLEARLGLGVKLHVFGLVALDFITISFA